MHPLAPDIPDSFPAKAAFGGRAVQIFIALALGIVLASSLDYRFGFGLAASGAAFALFGLIARSRSTKRLLWLPVPLMALVLISGAWTVARVGHAPSDSLVRVLADEPRVASVEGVLLDAPRSAGASGALAPAARYAPPSVRFRLSTRAVRTTEGDWATASGTLYVSVSATDRIGATAGDRVRLTGLASRLPRPGNPGAHDPGPSAMQRGIVGRVRVDSAELIETLGSAGGMRASASALRSSTIRQIEMAGERSDRSSSAALLNALLLGDREGDALGPLEDAFARAGVGHFLAISGLHVGMVLVGLAMLVRLTGERPRLELAVVLGACVLLLILIPARPPVLRAVLIALAFVLAQSTGRSYDRLSVLALVASGLLIARPIDLFNPGFQLTFLVVASLSVCAQPLRVWMFGEAPATDELHGWSVAAHRLKDAAAVSICASAVSTPLIAMHFGVFSPLAAPLSVLLMPLVALVLGIGYAAITLGTLIPAISDLAISLSLLPAFWLAETVRWIDRLPGVSWYLPSIGWGFTAAWLAVTVWWLFPSYATERRRWIASVLICVPLLYGAVIGPSLPRDQMVRIDMLDVGDGTSILLRSGREAILYDCGSRWLGIGERELPRAIRALGTGRVETVIVSHADIDHFSGLVDAARPLGVRRVIVTGHLLEQANAQPDGAARLLIDRLRELRIRVETVKRGDTVALASLDLEVLHPAPEDAFEGDNDASIVLRLRAGTEPPSPIELFLGDIERDAMQLLEQREPSLRADIIEVPHHGSARSFAYPFVEWLNPKILLQSTGPSRVLDDRWDDIRAGREWWTTATDGAISVVIERDGTVRTESVR